MGSLLDIKIRRETVEYDENQSFEVRAVSVNDLMTLVAENGPTLAMVWGRMQAEADDLNGLSGDDVRNIITTLAGEFPEIVSSLIALAADSYSEAGTIMAAQLDLTTQITAIEKIFYMTFRSEAELKKLAESLTRMAMGMSGALAQVRMPSQTGIGA